MWILIIGLIVLTAIAMAVGYARNKKIQKKIESGELQAAPEIVEADAERKSAGRRKQKGRIL